MTISGIGDFDMSVSQDGTIRLQCPECRDRWLLGTRATLDECIVFATAHVRETHPNREEEQDGSELPEWIVKAWTDYDGESA